MVKRLLVASGNPKKRVELNELLAGLPYEIVDLNDLGIAATVEEYGTTFDQNARIKAETYSAISGLLTISDDSGLVVDALQGAPGVTSARYGGEGLSDTDRYTFLLANLVDVPAERRTARFVSVIAIAGEGLSTVTFEGRCEGVILAASAGKGGFGYDPIFLPDGENRSMAELTPAEKHAISHRGKALKLAREWLKDNEDVHGN